MYSSESLNDICEIERFLGRSLDDHDEFYRSRLSPANRTYDSFQNRSDIPVQSSKIRIDLKSGIISTIED